MVPLRQHERVVIVGGSVAGLSVAEALRREGHEGPVAVIGQEPMRAYDRPPLSKGVLRDIAPFDAVALRGAGHLRELGVEERYGVAAGGVDLRLRTVHLTNGHSVPFDRLVVASGVHARRIPGTSGTSGVHVVRTFDDAVRLRAELDDARRVVVIGGGLVGTEVASVATDLGKRVVLATTSAHLLDRALGRVLGEQFTQMYRARGVRVRTGNSGRATAIVSRSNRVSGVRFSDGFIEGGDVVVMAIGSAPAIEWLSDSGLDVSDGLVCRADCSAAEGVYGAGDVASWPNERFGLRMRVEHRTNAVEQGQHVAAQITAGSAEPFTPVPYFWTDQLEMRVQAHGYLPGHDEAKVLEGSVAERRLVALYRRGDVVTGVVSIGAARTARLWRTSIEEGVLWSDAIVAGP